jgi:rhodanese-related sulfurtransferase
MTDRIPKTRTALSGALLAGVLAAGIAVLGGCASAPAIPVGAPTPATVRYLPADQFDTWRGVHYDGLILDVRNFGEWDDDLGHIDNAEPVPIEELESRLGQFERYKSNSVLVYDRTGTRAPSAGQTLVTNGFRDVSVLEGGLRAYRDWQKSMR